MQEDIVNDLEGTGRMNRVFVTSGDLMSDRLHQDTMYQFLVMVAEGECHCATDEEIRDGASPEYCPACRAAKILNAFVEDAEQLKADLDKKTRKKS